MTLAASTPAPSALVPSLPHGGLSHLDDFGRFQHLAHQQPFLEPDEERAAARAWRDGSDPEAGGLLVRAHLRLVVSMARRYRRHWPELMDLVQEGNLGLVEALYRYDPDRGTRFATYAAFWIRACILRFLMDNWSLVRIGRTRAGRRLFFELEREREALRAQGIDPSSELLAQRLQLEPAELEAHAARIDSSDLSIDAPDEDGLSLQDRLAGAQGSPEARAAREQVAALTRALMERYAAGLEGRRRAIWELRLAAEDPLSLSELGERFGVSKQRVSQVEARMKRELRELVEAELGGRVSLTGSA